MNSNIISRNNKMEASSPVRLPGPSSSIFSLTQSADQLLFRKYDSKFSFFLLKGINQIIFDQKSKLIVRDFKATMDYCEDTEYLKRYYRFRSSQGKQEIKERLTLLKNFYSSSDLLKYEYPMMVINRKETVFLKRHQLHNRLKKGQQQSQSSQESIPNSLAVSKKTNECEDHLVDLDWTQIFAGKYLQQQCDESKLEQLDISFDEEYCIFDSEKEIKRKEFLAKMGLLDRTDNPFCLSNKKNILQNEVSHLIVDFDDLDQQHVVEQYHKLLNKENLSTYQPFASQNQQTNKIKSVFQAKKTLSSSIVISADAANPEPPRREKHILKNRQSMFLGSREERFQEMQLIKQSSLLDYEREVDYEASFLGQSGQMENQSSSKQAADEQSHVYILPRKENPSISDNQFLTTTFGKKRKDIMKVSEIEPTTPAQPMAHGSFMKKHNELLGFKQAPIQFHPARRKQKDNAHAHGFPVCELIKVQSAKGEGTREDRKAALRVLNRVKSLQSFDTTPTNVAFEKKSKYR